MDWLALDIGGANLKAADGLGWTASRYFPLWRQPAELPAAIAALLRDAPHGGRADGIAVTMTGELADCFATKRQGVACIVDAAEQAAAGRTVRIYTTAGDWVTPDEARQQPLQAAAANWHALARFAARFVRADTGLLIDIGSTTTDIVPLRDAVPAPAARTDTERLACGELVYTGVLRSPVCAVVQSLPWRAQGRFGHLVEALGRLDARRQPPHLALERLHPSRRFAGDALERVHDGEHSRARLLQRLEGGALGGDALL